MQITLTLESPIGVQEGTFVLPESASILRYLATTKEVPDHWYPSKARLPCILQMFFVRLGWLAGSTTTPHQLRLDASSLAYARHTCRPTFAAGEPKAQARVNSALDWYHGNVRLHAAGLSWHRVIGKNMKQPVSEGQAKLHVAGMKTTFQVGDCL